MFHTFTSILHDFFYDRLIYSVYTAFYHPYNDLLLCIATFSCSPFWFMDCVIVYDLLHI